MLFGFSLKTWLIVGAVIAAFAAFGYITHQLKKAGYDKAMGEVQEQTNKAGDAAIEGARDVDACFDAGGVWIRSAGRCERP